MRLALDTEFSANSKILAVPALRYNFGIINWRQENLQISRGENKETANHPWTASPKADVDHLYVPRKQGGRGLKQLKEA